MSDNMNKPSHRANDPLDALEQRRKQKIEQFQLNLDEEFLDPQPAAPQPPQEERTSSVPQPKPAPAEPPKPSGTPQQDNLNSFSEEYAASQQKPPVLSKEEKKTARTAAKVEKKRKKAKAKKNGCLFKMIWLVMVVLVSVLLSQYILVGVNDMLAISRTDAETKAVIEIPVNSSLQDVANILTEQHVIDNPGFFKLYATVTRKGHISFTKGNYDMNLNMDYEAIINYLFNQENRKDTVQVTFYEGMNILEYAQHLEENNICSADEFLAYCNTDELDEDYSFLAAIDNKQDRYYKLEGYLFPDTYTYYEASKPEDVVRKMLNNYEYKINEPMEFPGYVEPVSMVQVAADKGMTMEDVTRLASIIQLEAGSTEDMATISSVFHNRLALSEGEANKFGEFGLSRLMSDVTVFYPYKNKAQLPADQQDFTSKYDTYNFSGLPAGPLCSPGKEALTAALFPEDTDLYYFLYSKDDPPVFYKARTLEQQNANKEKAGMNDE